MTAKSPSRQAPNWPLGIGLGALGLLWPLAALTGVFQTLGTPVTVALLASATAVAWIGCVGFSRTPRPVLTLAVAGTVHGVVLVAQSLTLGSHPGAVDGGTAVVVALFEIARSALLGTLAGLAALGLQLAGGGRR